MHERNQLNFLFLFCRFVDSHYHHHGAQITFSREEIIEESRFY